MKSNTLPFYLIILSIFIFITAPNLWSDGMFMDGLLYADISKNLAHNIGSFWNLKLTETLFSSFHEHPPLAFGLQSLFFRAFGDGLWVERLYSFLTFIIISLIVIKIWKQLVPLEYRTMAYIPLLILISVPVISWSASNNMLENTMTIFTLASILHLIKSLKKNTILNITLASLFLFLAILTKGLVAQYLLSFFFWVMLFDKKFNWKDFLLNSAIYFISLILIFGILFIIIPESKDNLLAYINKQVVGSLENIVTVESRFFIVKRLLSELIPAFIIATLFLITSRKINIIERKWMFILLILGLSGVFPIMISMKQSGFYILTTYPLFAMALSLLFISNSKILFDKMSFKTYQWIRISSFAILSSAIIFSLLQFNKVSRDKDMLEDIYTLSEIIPEGETISIQAIFYTNWGMHGYFYRTKNISLDPGKELRKYYITPKGEQIKLIHIKNTQLT